MSPHHIPSAVSNQIGISEPVQRLESVLNFAESTVIIRSLTTYAASIARERLFPLRRSVQTPFGTTIPYFS